MANSESARKLLEYFETRWCRQFWGSKRETELQYAEDLLIKNNYDINLLYDAIDRAKDYVENPLTLKCLFLFIKEIRKDDLVEQHQRDLERAEEIKLEVNKDYKPLINFHKPKQVELKETNTQEEADELVDMLFDNMSKRHGKNEKKC